MGTNFSSEGVTVQPKPTDIGSETSNVSLLGNSLENQLTLKNHLGGCICEGCRSLAINKYPLAPAPVVGATVTLGSLPLLSSNPNATSKIFLDFNGHTTSGTYWNDYNGGANIVTPAYSIDADTATFSTTEIANIEQIWKRVAEDYAPFNVDVTTIDPGNLNSAYNIRAVIGGSSDQWYGSLAGGVAWLTSWQWNNDTPVFVFEENLVNGDPKFTAEAVSHEVGHSLGLNHQSTYDANGNKTEEYNSGSGSGETGWAPIMGLSYYQNLTTWHNGTSSLGSTTYQDDMSVISATNNGFSGYRSDDHGNTISSATPLSGTTTLTGSGIITRTSDVDVFSFQTGAGSVNFTINPAQYGPNLDILAQLLDSSGTVIASSNSSSNLFANLNTSVSAGTYFVSVKSNGQYGRVGQYSISGTVPSGDTTPPTANSFTPADNATGVAVGANLVVNFSEAIKKGSGNLVIKKLSDNSVVETIAVTAANITVSGSQLTINPTANLLQGTDYYIGIANGAIKDTAGNNYAGITGNTTWNFKTVVPTDTTPPTASSFTPADNATGVAVGANLVGNFSEAIKKGSGNLVIKKLSDNSVVETIAVTAANITVSGSQLTINPTANLAQNTDYYIGIANGAIKDIAGNNYAGITGNTTWNFKTVVPTDTTPPTASSFTPADNATGVAVGANLVVNFSEAIKKGSGNLVIKKLSDNSVVETIAVTAANITVSGSQLTINPTANLLQGTDYYVGIANGAIKDTAGNNYAGITGNSTWNFKTQTLSSFTPDTSVSLPGVSQGSVAWSDYSGDGKPDFLLTGEYNLYNPISKLYKNTGSGFSEDTSISLPGVFAGSVAWSDYSGDGKPDFLLTGYDSSYNSISKLYKNTGSGFIEDTSISLPGVSYSSVAWSDYSGDGKPDFLLTGSTGYSSSDKPISKLYKNTGSGFIEDTSISLPGVAWSSVAWSDYSGDGKPDFLLTGSSSLGSISKLYKNTGSGFSEDTSISLPGVLAGSVAWSDYNGDAKPDFLLTGQDSSNNSISKLYKNTGSGFSEDTSIPLLGVLSSSVAWSDYNGDAKPDLLLTGYSYSSSNKISKLYKNTGSGFIEDTSISLPGVEQSSVAWSDYSGDGKPDLLLTGNSYYSNNYISKLYKNTTTTSDTTSPKASSFTPGDNSTIVAVDANLVVNFSEAIKKGTGNIVIKKLSDNSVVETIAVTATNVILNGNQLTINPTANLVTGTSYYIEIANGAIKDIAGNNYVGITGNSTWNFKTQGFSAINSTANNDILTGTANPETINGLGGNDKLLGNGGNDSLNGGDGIDTLDGGAANDTLTGGLGADKFIYNTNAAFATSAVGVDTITDFNISQTDQIVLDKTTFTSISSAAGTGFSVASEFAKVTTDALAATSAADIVYNTATGGLFYNQNGAAAGFGTGAQFLTLTTKPALTGNQFLIQA
ncbi:MAG: Ig-like domain-containing protein [Limnoraphis sp. WC205]|nr:Ig-like domain-containing protein [Limnoraphis sp. WC205]